MMQLHNVKVKFRHATSAGVTEATMFVKRDHNAEQEIRASSKVHPNDNYCREIGRRKVLQRLLKLSNLSRLDKMLVWEAYRNSAPSPRWSTPCFLKRYQTGE